MHVSLQRPIWALLFVIGIAITIASCGGSSSGPDLSKLEIVNVVPDSGMVGDTVTIEGSGGFASKLSDNLLTFNGTPATVLSTTPDELITQVPAGATSGRLTLKVEDQTVKGPHFKVLSFDPVITGVSPAQAIPGTKVQVKGKYFLSGGSSKTKTPDTPLPANPKPKSPLAKNNINNTSSLGALGAQRPVPGTQSPKPNLIQNIATPQQRVSSAQSKGNPTATITNADAISITIGGQQAPVHSASDTLLVTEVPEGASGNIITVTLGEESISWDTFQLLAPLTVTNLSPESGPVGTSVTVQGAGFHATADSNIVAFNGIEAEVTAANSTELMAVVPQKANTGPVTIEAHGQTIEAPTFTVTVPAVDLSINGISPTGGPVGTYVTITGQGFSDIPSENIVSFDGNPATVTSANSTELMAAVPEGATTGPVSVTVDNKTVTGPTFNVSTNNPPEFTSSASVSVKENSTPVDTLAATDADGDALTFGISDGADSNQFTIDENSGIISFVSAPDFEAPSDTNADNIYQLQTEVSDGKLTATRELSITVKNVNDVAPTITSSNAITMAENTSPVDTVTASDPEGDAIAFTLSGGDDQNLFTMDEQAGALAFKNAPDYENPGDTDSNNIYEIQITASDGSLSASQDLTVTITDVNENKSPSFTNSSSLTINENNTVIDTLTVSDPEGDAITLSISGGDDRDLFSLEQNGELSFNTAPDHEAPADADNDNIYHLQVQADDGNGSTTQDMTVDVQNLNDNSPVITQSTYEVEENKTEIGTIAASDPDGDNLTYELNGGVDENFFTLDTQTGALNFDSPRDYEQPTDGQQIGSTTDNEYEVSIVVRDGENKTFGSLSVIVTNVAEPVEILRAIINNEYRTEQSNGQFVFNPVPDGTDTGSSAIIIALDDTKGTIQSATIGGPDAGLFTIEGILTSSFTGDRIQISGPVLNYDHSADGTPHQYEFTVTTTSTEGATAVPQTFVIPITPFNGKGTASDPYIVSTLEQLQAVGMFPNAYFLQKADIDASPTANWNGDEGFKPIKNNLNSPFDGTYDGNDYTISNLSINKDADIIGLFGHLGPNGTIKNVHLINADIITSGSKIGILVGYNNEGTIENCSTSGSVVNQYPIAMPAITSGGLVGMSELGIIINSHSSATVTGGSAGGLVGETYGTEISGSSASGNVSGSTSVGGLVGYLGDDVSGKPGNIINSSATGNVTAGEENSAGGLVGFTDNGWGGNEHGIIKSSWASGDVQAGRRLSNIGGLVGANEANDIIDCYATGNVTGGGKVGGLVGLNKAPFTIERSFSTGNVTASDEMLQEFQTYGGGLVAYNKGTISNSFAVKSNVIGNNKFGPTSLSGKEVIPRIGGLAAYNSGTIKNSYVAVGMSGIIKNGLTYWNGGSVQNSYWDMEQSGRSSSDGGTGLTTDQMTGQNAVSMGFDFTNIWEFQTNPVFYPTLRGFAITINP